MSRPLDEIPADAEFQSARMIRQRLGVSETKVKNLALMGAIEVRTTTSVINLYSVTDVKREMEKRTEYGRVRRSPAIAKK